MILTCARLLLVALLCAGCSTRVQVLFQRPSKPTADGSMPDAGQAPKDAAALDGSKAPNTQDAELPPDATMALPSGAFDVAVGAHHTCAIMGGPLYCWGGNSSGQLGLGDRMNRLQPARVGVNGDWTQVSLGEDFSCALNVDGSVYCFGLNTFGQLGLGNRTDRQTPTPVVLPAPARSIHAGFSHACAILQTDELYCWGQNAEGQLAQGDPFPQDGTDRPTPVLVDGVRAQTAGAGQGHGCLVDVADNLYCWGRNSDGQVGVPGAPGQLRSPLLVTSQVAAVSAAMLHTCAQALSGEVLCWGENTEGQLGTGDRLPRAAPTVLPTPPRAHMISAATFSTCVVSVAGGLFCFGRNVEGQLGLGDTLDRLTPTEVPLPGNAEKVATGRFHTCVQLTDGDVLCSGNNETGELGLPDGGRRETFTPVLIADGIE